MFPLLALFFASALAAPIDNSTILMRDVNPYDTTLDPLAYAPDYSKDPFPPYPSVKDANGKDLTAQNWRKTRLFGFKGCSGPDQQVITSTWDDFYRLAQQESLYKNIDWNSQAAQEIWGHATGNRAISDDTKKQIQQIYESTQQMYATWWLPPYDGPGEFQPPTFSWRTLWIRVACSPDGDDTNTCGDKPVKDPNCPNGERKPDHAGQVEAYSEPDGWYSKIVFCNYFFNSREMRTLDEAIDGAKNHRTDQHDLWSYQNRARVMFHEVTHLNYFMNAPSKSPKVVDLTINVAPKKGDNGKNKKTYGPELIKTLANYEAVGKGGFYTQRNADSFAWFAVANWIQKQMGFYPSNPVIRSRPVRAPRDENNQPFSFSVNDVDTVEPEWDGTFDHNVPGCSDVVRPKGLVTASAQGKPTCDNTVSEIPYNVFGSHTTGVYAQFCAKLDTTPKLTVDSHGYAKKVTKRTPPPNPDAYSAYTFDLAWQPLNNCVQTNDNCLDAFEAIKESPCGHQGGEQNVMAGSGKYDIPGCGTYTYKINGPPKPSPPPPPPQPPQPTLGAQQCNQAFKHRDTHKDDQAEIAKQICGELNGHMITTDSKTWIHYDGSQEVFSDNDYKYDITWVNGCTSSVSQFDAGKPLSDNAATCVSLLTNDYLNCNNGGAGGSITAGCVNYSFSVTG